MIKDFEVKTKAQLRKFLIQEVKGSAKFKNESPEDIKKVVDFTVNKMKNDDDVNIFMRGYMGKPKIVIRSDLKDES